MKRKWQGNLMLAFRDYLLMPGVHKISCILSLFFIFPLISTDFQNLLRARAKVNLLQFLFAKFKAFIFKRLWQSQSRLFFFLSFLFVFCFVLFFCCFSFFFPS